MTEAENSYPLTARPTKAFSRWQFPAVNALIFGALFGVVGYYVFNPVLWALVGLAGGLVVGATVEVGLGLVGGWIYRRRVTLTVLIEIVLVIAYVGPFAYMVSETLPHSSNPCCMEDSGLGEQVEAVLIPVADGETLSGWYAPPSDGSGAVVMVLHGSSGNRRGSLAHARVLHEAGYGVLVYDQRAAGESSGDRNSFGLYDRRDITPIMDWLSARPEVDAERIGGVGLSLGAHILVMAGPEEPRLKAIWSDGLGPCGSEDFLPARDASDVLVDFISRQTYWQAELYLGVQIVPCQELIPQIAPRHLMLVAGGKEPYEREVNRAYEALLGENGAVWIIDGTGHLGGLKAEAEEYPRRMVEFFDRALR